MYVMKILVLSDSHLHSVKLDLNDYDYVIHCGDGNRITKSDNVFCVRGNCDFRGEKEKIVEIKNKKILITHGDLYNVKYGYTRLSYKALESEVDICLFGHTHIADVFEFQEILFINPGAYQDGYYVIIEDNKINFYYNNECYKEFNYKW